MKVGIAQLNPTVGRFAHNIRRIKELIEDGKRNGAELLVFPELAVMGYPPRDCLDFPAFIEEAGRAVDEVRPFVTKGVTVVLGIVERNPSPTGRSLFNAAVVLRDGRILAGYRKRLLPYYDVFDEERHFEPGRGTCLFDQGGTRVAVTICEDVWNSPEHVQRLYADPVIDGIRREKPALLLNLSASPFHLGKPEERIRLFQGVAAAVGATSVVCNQVGGNDELVFDGCSLAVRADGTVIAAGKAFEEDLVLFDTAATAAVTPPWPSSEGEWLFKALALGLGDYVRKCGESRVVLGLSGGVDSSVTAAIAASALGPEAVLGVALPTRFNASISLDDAETLARELGVTFRVLPVEPLFSLYADLWRQWFHRDAKAVTLENLQPRIRMTLLMALANEEGRLLLNTSNKSEMATGYSTLYGDSAGALAVLGDLTKGQIYALARYINRERVIIPARAIARAPSAELKENQTDQDTLPPYDVLDPLVKASVEGLKTPSELLAAGFPADAVAKYRKLHGVSEYKRRQAPPVIRVSPRAFGMGRRMPIAAVRPGDGRS